MGRKFPWLPVLLISLIAQWIVFEVVYYIEARTISISINHPMYLWLIFFNNIVVATIGGMVSRHYLNVDKKFVCGISSSLFIIAHSIYFGRDPKIIGLVITFGLGYIGAIIYDKIKSKRHLNNVSI